MEVIVRAIDLKYATTTLKNTVIVVLRLDSVLRLDAVLIIR